MRDRLSLRACYRSPAHWLSSPFISLALILALCFSVDHRDDLLHPACLLNDDKGCLSVFHTFNQQFGILLVLVSVLAHLDDIGKVEVVLGVARFQEETHRLVFLCSEHL